jgi:hypothetical protein
MVVLNGLSMRENLVDRCLKAHGRIILDCFRTLVNLGKTSESNTLTETGD